MGRVYTRAAICKRGHTNTRNTARISAERRCPDCGAVVLTDCPSCGAPIRGDVVTGELSAWGQYSPPQFCADCGTPFPWVSRQGRIYELENLLDEEDLDPADELAAREQLQALAGDDLDEVEQARRWARLKALAPGLMQKAGAQRIVETVVTAAIRSQLGI